MALVPQRLGRKVHAARKDALTMSSAQQTTYRGYVIRRYLASDNWYVIKDGRHIWLGASEQDCRHTIDRILETAP